MSDPSVYPAELDTLKADNEARLLQFEGTPDPSSEFGEGQIGHHAGLHNAVANAIMAIEKELGIEPSGTQPTVAARLKAIEAALGASEGSLASQVKELEEALEVIKTSAGVVSFKGRVGAVAPAANDYTVEQITGLVAQLTAITEAIEARSSKAELTTEKGRAEGAEAAEKAAREAADVTVKGEVKTEKEAREAGDTGLKADVKAEKEGREAADATVKGEVKTEKERAEAAEEGKQPLDGDLTSIAALGTTAFGRGLLTLPDAAAGRTALGMGGVLAELVTLDGRLDKLDKNQDFTAGERLFGFGAQNAAGKKFELLGGTTAAPDEGNEPLAVISRVLKTPQSAFSGDGAGNLAALRVHTTAVAGSEGQAVGLAASAITFATFEEGHSLSDAIGAYCLGVSKGESTRTGMGIFVNGRTEAVTGRATGMEIVVDNETEVVDSWNGTFPRTKAIHMHGAGTARSSVGMFISDRGAGLHTGIAAMTGALLSSAFIRDDSEAPWSVLIKGKHAEAALAVASGSGSIVVGVEKPANATTLIEVNGGAEVHDPLINFKVTGSKSARVRLIENGGTGQVNAFVAGGANSFLTGTVLNDSGIGFGPGTNFHLGANGKTSIFRAAEAALGFFGTAPQAKPEVTGSRGGNAALASFLEKMAGLGLITNGTTA